MPVRTGSSQRLIMLGARQLSGRDASTSRDPFERSDALERREKFNDFPPLRARVSINPNASCPRGIYQSRTHGCSHAGPLGVVIIPAQTGAGLCAGCKCTLPSLIKRCSQTWAPASKASTGKDFVCTAVSARSASIYHVITTLLLQSFDTIWCVLQRPSVCHGLRASITAPQAGALRHPRSVRVPRPDQ